MLINLCIMCASKIIEKPLIKYPRGAYLFLGMEESGKTVFFTSLCDLLQREGNNNPDFKFEFIPCDNDKPGQNSTDDYIRANLRKIRNQEWPDKTDVGERMKERSLTPYTCVLSVPGFLFGTNRYTMSYIDYPGEAFRSAFSPDGNYKGATEQVRNIGSLLRGTTNKAKGIFLLIDAEAVMNADADKKDIMNRIWGTMFLTIRQNNPGAKVALIFNKMELFNYPGAERDVLQRFKDDFSNAYTAYELLRNKKHYFVQPLGSIDTEADGRTVPPKERTPKNMLEVAEWMFNYDLRKKK